MGAVYVLVSNTHHSKVECEYIDVEIPVGNDARSLTNDPQAIKPSVDPSYPTKPREKPKLVLQGATVFRAQLPGKNFEVPSHESLVLELAGIPVAGEEGLVRLKIHEKAGGGDSNRPIRRDPFTETLGVVKQTPKIPRNFRPEKTSRVDADKEQKITLLWDGPSNLDYWLRDPEGNEVPAFAASTGPQVTQQPYRYAVPAPKRGTTYTLIAGTSTTGANPVGGYFLTTTVHARIPEFESGTRTPWIEGTQEKGRVAFSGAGVEIRKNINEWGTVAADQADVNGVHTKWVQGRDDAAGWIEFPAAGVNVFRGGGSRDWGTVAADKADLNDLAASRAQIQQRLTIRGGLTVAGVLETEDGPPRLLVHGRLDVDGGLNAAANVVAAGDVTVNGVLRPTRDLDVGGAITAADLTVRDKLTTQHERFTLVVHGESLYLGKVNANRHLSVRTGEAWIMHTNDDQISVQANLRVHGAFRSDS
ncbi:hypothetical protein RM844_14155 [Streptomyces sp. DSM 44915]|uniref:Uncharacterized protein n=1 Tax=Streptomyces chisholmiae TaxID=3075540 RepID=A0ABU2JR22_9ACTN|nr:hypothetical protein [Streptomyces sp. DSM 44915]MDT0267430.1 hypothetical protein [Streptomyces sp. DSM 44915]